MAKVEEVDIRVDTTTKDEDKDDEVYAITVVIHLIDSTIACNLDYM